MTKKKTEKTKVDLPKAMKGTKTPSNYTGKGPKGLKKSKHSAFENGDMGIGSGE